MISSPQTHPAYRGREDYIFTGRQQVEYHLYLVGAEIMNRANREKIPRQREEDHLRAALHGRPRRRDCQAKDTPLGRPAAHPAHPSCQVHQVTKLGEKIGADVFMIPDSFSPLSGGGSGMGETSMGIIGVSCPLTITGGGWEMKRLGVPARGCFSITAAAPGTGIWTAASVTEINFSQLLKILDI